MRVRLLVLTVALMLTAAACGPVDWLMFRFGPARTGSSSDTTISKDAVRSSMVLNWTGTLGDVTFSSPAVAKGVVYVGAQDGKFYAFDAAGNGNCSGTPKACAPLWTGGPGGSENSFDSSPAVVEGVVYVGSQNDQLYAFDAAGSTNCSGTPKTCQPLWTATTGASIQSSPVVTDGLVYVGSEDHRLYVFDAAGATNCSGGPPTKSCQPLWVGDVADVVGFASPAVGGGLAYVSTTPPLPAGGTLQAFDAAGTTNCSGGPPTKVCSPIWGATTGDSIASSPAVAGGVVYVGAENDGAAGSALLAFDAAGNTNCSGTPKVCQPLWKAALGGGGSVSFGISSPAVTGGIVHIGSKDGKLYAFDAAGNTNCSGTPKTCQPLWTATTGANIQSSPAVANGVVYVGSNDHKLYAFDAAGATNCSGGPPTKTCAPLWTVTTGGSVISSPAVSRGAVYVGSHDQKLYAFALESVPPTTSVLAPSNGATLSGTTTLVASASDNVKVSRVEFRLTGGSYDNVLIGVATPSYYGWIYDWNTTSVPNGSYALNSVAYDPAGNQGRSPGISITVQN